MLWLNIKQISFFSIVFKAIWTLLSCDYFWTIKNFLITLGWCILSLSLRLEIKGY